MSHFTSEQFPSGRPAIVDEPHAPANADAGDVVELDAVFPPLEPEPATPPVSDTAVGAVSVFSNPHPAASVDASSRLRRQTFFIIGPYSLCIGKPFLVCSDGHACPESHEIDDGA